MVCDEPHLVVWLKRGDSHYWPAKVMSIQDEWLNLQFFGDHTADKVSNVNCFLCAETKINTYQLLNTWMQHSKYMDAMKVSSFFFKSIDIL